MKISIVTLFPEVFDPILNTSILKRAQNKGKVTFELINLRDFGEGKHQIVDDRPYGGGVGMVLKANVLAKAVKSIEYKVSSIKPPKASLAKGGGRKQKKDSNCTLLMSASGTPYKQSKAQQLSKLDHITLVCGHYEGVDQRFVDKYVDEEISIGDYVLTGGEIPAMVIIDSIVRLISGVLEKPEAVQNESFSNYTPAFGEARLRRLDAIRYTLLEGPQYTRPEEFEGTKVPKVLLSGNHGEIEKWRQKKALEKTKKVRPDL